MRVYSINPRLAAIAALLLLTTACGGDSGSDTTEAAAATTTTAATTQAPATTEATTTTTTTTEAPPTTTTEDPAVRYSDLDERQQEIVDRVCEDAAARSGVDDVMYLEVQAGYSGIKPLENLFVEHGSEDRTDEDFLEAISAICDEIGWSV